MKDNEIIKKKDEEIQFYKGTTAAVLEYLDQVQTDMSNFRQQIKQSVAQRMNKQKQ